jgi:hypothetical protein
LIRKPFSKQRHLDIEFTAPEVSSDGGVLLLREVDKQLGLTESLAGCLRDSRASERVVHSRHEQVRQRIFQIAMGWEDCDDADFLRLDPLWKTACGRLPEDPAGLSSQPTLSRFENAVDGKSLGRMLRRLEQSWLDSLPEDREAVILDVDSTDDPVHGQQQLGFFHGYFDSYVYHPFMIFDGSTGELITAILRPGNTHASRGVKGVLRRLIRKIRRRCPQTPIVVRGDSGFAVPRILRELERLDGTLGGVDYLLGIARNDRLLLALDEELAWAQELHEKRGQKVVRFTSFRYAARSWERRRRIVGKAEFTGLGRNPRFVVTSLELFDPETLYRAYCERGRCELWIKDFKNALAADRLSCSAFRANFFRLLLHAAAYRLLHALRGAAAHVSMPLGKAQLDTLRVRLLKIAALVTQSTRRILIRLPGTHPEARTFHHLLEQLPSLAPG